MLRFDCVIPDLEAELRGLLAQIPSGRVATHGDLAGALGLRTAARWVGAFLRDHDHTAACPCHRVVRKDGEIGLYLRDAPPASKEERLRREGVLVWRGVIELFAERVFRDFQSRAPLARLIDFQERVAGRVRLVPYRGRPRLAAGLDVSYCRDGTAVGCCTVVESGSGRLVWSTTQRSPAPMPYIPSLLTFRELPVFLALFDECRKECRDVDLYFVDGNGILHPRGAGVAACFGVVADVPTVGVAKSQLCGCVESDWPPIADCCPVTIDGAVVGVTERASRSSRRLYVSPGQRIDVPGAASMARMLHFGHRLPEPLYWADRFSRSEARRTQGQWAG